MNSNDANQGVKNCKSCQVSFNGPTKQASTIHIKKLCFRDESGRFGCPKSALNSSITPLKTLPIECVGECSNSFGFRGTSEEFQLVTFTERECIVFKNPRDKERVTCWKFPIGSTKFEDIQLYALDGTVTKVFALMTDLDSSAQYIAIIEVANERSFKIIEKRQLKGATFQRIEANAAREVAVILSANAQIVQSFELACDEEPETVEPEDA